jgi:hypothetical protein
MVVLQKHRGAVDLQGSAHHHTGMQRDPVDGAPEQPLEGDQPMAVVEEGTGELLVGQVQQLLLGLEVIALADTEVGHLGDGRVLVQVHAGADEHLLRPDVGGDAVASGTWLRASRTCG